MGLASGGARFLPSLNHLAVDLKSDDLLQAAGRIALVAFLAIVAVMLLRRLARPILGVAIREQMASEPEIEVSKRIDTLTNVLNTTTATIIAIIALVTVLPEFGINIGPILAGLGLVGVAVGFGSQSLIKDVINGVEILTENQYGLGDYVSIRSSTGGNVAGIVEDINLRRSVLRDFDGNMHFVSHGQIDIATNHTKGFSRVVMTIPVAYSADIDEVHKVVGLVGTEMMKDPSLSKMLREAPHAAGMERLGDGFVEVRVEGVTEPGEQWRVAPELRRRLKHALDEAGIKSKDAKSG